MLNSEATTETRATPTISVALCTYNGARYLPEQLWSVASQTRLPDELVVCDDASSDATLEILDRFAQEAPFGVRIYRNERNLGSTKNFEKVIGLCRGEFIALSDQDDIWFPDRLARQSEVLAADRSLGGVFSDAELIGGNSNPVGKRLWQLLYLRLNRPNEVDRDRMIKLFLIDNIVTGATFMIRASTRDFIGLIPESWIHDGWIAWMLVLYSRLTFMTVPLIQYRIHDQQQVGIDTVSIRRKLMELRKGRKRELGVRLKQFEDLRARWISNPGASYQDVLLAIEGNISFLNERNSVSLGGIWRIGRILALSRSYKRYAHGFRSILNDVAFCIVRSVSRLLKFSSNPT
jgi:glycosyltransferase involved in cell wall biosynthesis